MLFSPSDVRCTMTQKYPPASARDKLYDGVRDTCPVFAQNYPRSIISVSGTVTEDGGLAEDEITSIKTRLPFARALRSCPPTHPTPPLFVAVCCLLSPTSQVEISFYLLRRLLGVKTQEGGKQVRVVRIASNRCE